MNYIEAINCTIYIKFNHCYIEYITVHIYIYYIFYITYLLYIYIFDIYYIYQIIVLEIILFCFMFLGIK